MSLYVLPENQKMIWDTISKVPLFRKLSNETHNSEQWFQNIIGHHHNKFQNKRLNKDDLRNLNKETIQYMLHDLKNKYSLQPATSNNLFNNNTTFQSNLVSNDVMKTNTTETRGFILEQKQNTINNQFQTRQEEYGSLIKRPNVNEIDVRENMQEDKPIENMEELIQKQLREREYEIQPKQLVKEEIIDIGAVEIQEKEHKSVKWDDEQVSKEKESYTELKQMLHDFMEKMANEIKDIRSQLLELKNDKNLFLDDNSTERMKNIMSKLQHVEEKGEKIESDVKLSTNL